MVRGPRGQPALRGLPDPVGARWPARARPRAVRGAGPGPARHHDAGHQRLGRVPAAPRAGARRPRHHADRARRGGRSRARARAGRGRLRHQAVRAARAARPDPRRAAPARAAAEVRGASPSATCGCACAAARSYKAGREIALTRKEFDLLRYLVEHQGEVVTRDRLLDEVWGYDQFPTTRTVDTHILRLRQKFERDPERPVHILTVHGQGYRFAGPDERGATTHEGDVPGARPAHAARPGAHRRSGRS